MSLLTSGSVAVVNGGTGSYALEAIGVALLFVVLPIAVYVFDARQDRRALAAILREQQHPLVQRAAVAPLGCRFCGGTTDWHHEGCGLLDRLDTPRRSA